MTIYKIGKHVDFPYVMLDEWYNQVGPAFAKKRFATQYMKKVAK
jgi:hypothetical protein